MLSSAGCSPIVIAVPSGSIDRARDLLGSHVGILIVEGGATRQGSVARGLERIDTEAVVVHDAARPFASARLIGRLLEALVQFDGAISAIPVKDTIKEAPQGRILSTVDRTPLWRAQTPQAFRTKRLRGAHANALERGLDATDDAQLVESYGGAVGIVEGSEMNIKLTTPEDFVLAEAMIAAGIS
jgi:2-C-methyl-D-erythritol 4-phosphate cytidylyltransferase